MHRVIVVREKNTFTVVPGVGDVPPLLRVPEHAYEPIGLDELACTGTAYGQTYFSLAQNIRRVKNIPSTKFNFLPGMSLAHLSNAFAASSSFSKQPRCKFCPFKWPLATQTRPGAFQETPLNLLWKPLSYPPPDPAGAAFSPRHVDVIYAVRLTAAFDQGAVPSSAPEPPFSSRAKFSSFPGTSFAQLSYARAASNSFS